MHSFHLLIDAHPGIAVGVGFYILSTAVGTMPSPADNAGMFYKWLFGFLHAITGGIPRIVATLAPQYGNLVGANAAKIADATPKP